ncbi:hypothetical protein K435DRAFT_821824 [Dendrothele bispora CBS 962.96]|uniref:Uncharacterized protein n=1 Tax=Dendrothele bispora (strain CBS 962.96) TaxID=1314807 RepID=A0A4V4HDP0_DENBC|nr:hypothetical protein K435DRAFT_821824 [Dendrothele bispora CBS 962.96]
MYHGNGTSKPTNLIHNKATTSILNDLCQHWAFKRMSGFANGVFAAWAPCLWDYYSTYLKKLLASDPELKTPFPSSVYSTTTFNFGPRTVCLPHIDYSNLPFGWCAIWALGNFDPTKGGHLILWDLKLVVEFPPGSLIFIPSGVCLHSNVPIGTSETRYSFAQFTPSSLFRWVDQGFQTKKEYLTSCSEEDMKRDSEQSQRRWKMGLELLTSVSELDI